MASRIARRVRVFLRAETGDVSLESIIILPVVLWLLGAVWVWHDFSHRTMLEQKVNYTLGDMISRETDPLDAPYMDHAYELALYMLDSRPDVTDLRITVVRQTRDIGAHAPEYEVVWSVARGAATPLSGNLDAMSDRLPVMARNDQVIVVETWSDYFPLFSAGLVDPIIASYSFTRPRFAPQILFAGGDGSGAGQNNGWGNGDQTAPGNSLCNTNAENYDEGQASNQCAANADGSQNVEGSGRGSGSG